MAINPAMDAMLTMEPDPRPIIAGRTAWDMWSTPSTLTRHSRSRSPGVVVSAVPTCPMPALFTSTSHRPCAASTWATPFVHDASSATSTTSASARCPASRIRRAVASAAAPSRSVAHATAPAAAKHSAIAAPMPEPAPVTMAMRSARENMGNEGDQNEDQGRWPQHQCAPWASTYTA